MGSVVARPYEAAGAQLEGEVHMLAEKEVAAPAVSVATDPIFVAIEMSRSKWVIGTHVPTATKVGIHAVEWGDVDGLLQLFARLRGRAADATGTADAPILCCYEAGYEGFWLYRRLTAAGVRMIVIDPSSLLVNRRAKRAKTDRIDAKAMIRALMAYNRGEDQVLSEVQVPSVDQEDHRRLVRERQCLVYDCTAHTNRIRGLLLTQGVVGFDPRADDADEGVDQIDSGTKGDRAKLIQRFAPYYNESSSTDLGDKEIRVLVSTDVLSEGLNLQDATRLINYDLHWNPVRLMQRIGRVDRRMNPEIEARIIRDHPDQKDVRGTVAYWNFLPPDDLDELLRLTVPRTADIYSGKGKCSMAFDALLEHPDVSKQTADGTFELYNVAIASALKIAGDTRIAQVRCRRRAGMDDRSCHVH